MRRARRRLQRGCGRAAPWRAGSGLRRLDGQGGGAAAGLQGAGHDAGPTRRPQSTRDGLNFLGSHLS